MKATIRTENGNVLLEINGKPAYGLKFRADGGFDAFSACAPLPPELLREIYRYARVFFKPHETKFYTVLPQKE